MRLGRTAAGIFLGCVVSYPSFGEAADVLRGAAPGVLSDARSGKGQTERLVVTPGLAEGLLAVPVDSAVRVEDWPVAPGLRRPVVVSRRDVYAADARIVAMGPNGPIDVPRSSLAFLWGSVDGDGSSSVLVWVDPETHALGGASATPDGHYDLTPVPAGLRTYDLAAHEGEPGGFQCGNDALHEDSIRERLRQGMRNDAPTTSLISSVHTAVVAVDTDNELMNLKFSNNTTSATNYIAELIAGVAAIYERDLRVRPLQGHTILRPSTTADPYVSNAGGNADSAKLDEVSAYWNANYGAITRALVVFLSGKQPQIDAASGIAWRGSLCESYYGVSFNQVFRSPTLTAASDIRLVSHEMGHNFGSPHTHCTDTNLATAGMQPIDFCYAAECGGDWSPNPGESCPAAFTVSPANGAPISNVRGTVMSYCHQLSGCPRTTVFHPQSVSLVVSPEIDAAVGRCLFPLTQVTGINPNAGTTAGGTAVTITGAGFAAPATVALGGTPATAVNVANSTTITATTAAHAAGIVDVAVTVPSGAVTLAGGFHYFTPPPPGQFRTVTPCRLIDTRAAAAGGLGSPALVASIRRNFTVATAANICGVPPTAKALSVNVTVTGPTQPGFVSLFPGDSLPPATSSINFSAGQTRANNAVVLLATNGAGTLSVLNGSAGTVHLIVDVNGYFQ